MEGIVSGGHFGFGIADFGFEIRNPKSEIRNPPM